MTSITIPLGSPDTLDILRGAPVEGGSTEGDAPEGASSLVGHLLPGFLFDPADLGPETLTPEMILVMLQKRLSALDSQIHMETAAIQNAAKESEGLSEMIQAVGALRDAMAAKKPKSNEKVDLDNITVTIGDDTYTGTELIQELELQDEIALDSNNKISRDPVTGFIDRLQIRQRTLNSNNEMTMVRLQSAIGKRQQAIQLSTNMVNNINQSLMDIIRNTK